MGIQKIHEDVLNLLLSYRDDNPDFTFGLRSKNNSNRLDKGHWFLGDDKYVAITFWTGRDWKNRTPNLFFRIDKYGSCSFEISVADSQDKMGLAKSIMANISGFNTILHGRGFQKNYFTQDYIKCLEKFLSDDKPRIDKNVQNYSQIINSNNKYDQIRYFTEEEFRNMLDRVQDYRIRMKPHSPNLDESITGIKMTSKWPEINIEIDNIPKNARWIFFTGTNGIGKSTILKGIAATILGGKLQIDDNDATYSIVPDVTKASLSFQKNGKPLSLDYTPESGGDYVMPFSGFTAYGPIRHGSANDDKLKGTLTDHEFSKRTAIARSLFFDDALLLQLDMELLNQKYAETNKIEKSNLLPKNLVVEIIELFPDLIPDLVRIITPFESTIENLWSNTEYVFEDQSGDHFEAVEFDSLSSGHKSMVNFVGDMMIQLILSQRNIENLAQLKGVVLIDEIDIHLHPINQKSLVEGLSDTFPDIQFIVTTHSPIPMLGAPKESIFYKVERTVADGITASLLDIDISDLLPNTILSSPLFGFDEIIQKNHDHSSLLRTENDYQEAVFYKILNEKIRSKQIQLGQDNDKN